MRFFRHEDFSGEIGNAFEVPVGNGFVTLSLAEAEVLGSSPRAEGAFRLLFRGPRETPLAQGNYTFRANGHEDAIFIVPVGLDSNGMQYEAIFS